MQSQTAPWRIILTGYFKKEINNSHENSIEKDHTYIMYLFQPDHFTLTQVTSENHDEALQLIKRYFLSEHVLVRARNMDISNDCALDEYLIGLLKQGAKSRNFYFAAYLGVRSWNIYARHIRSIIVYKAAVNRLNTETV